MGKSIDFGSISKDRVVIGKQMFPLSYWRRMYWSHPFHCVKMMILWQLMFCLFGLCWVLSSSVREILLGWYNSLIGKNRKRKGHKLKHEEFSNQRLKSTFLCNLSLWIKLYVDESPMLLIDFVDWLSSYQRREYSFCSCLLTTIVYILCTLVQFF